MDANGTKKILGREELKKYFKSGTIPLEKYYLNLIDAMIHRSDDGFSKDEENGLIISSSDSSKRLMSFYQSMNDLDPFFAMERDNKESPSLKFKPINKDGAEKGDGNNFFFHLDGKLGVGKRCEKEYKVEVDGFVGMKGRVGTYKSGQVPANGQWHPILTGLDNCKAFEVMARTGKRGSGKFSIMQATALSAFGASRSKIKKTCAYYGFFWNKLNLRWNGKTHDYALELRTNSNYGKGVEIYYTIANLWDDEMFLPEDYYYPIR